MEMNGAPGKNDLVTKVSYGETDEVKNIYLFKVTGEE